MAFDLSALTNYTNEQRTELLLKAQLGAKTSSIITVIPGVKGPTALNMLDTDVVFQANGCGFNASGTTTMSNRVITPGDIKVNEILCPKDLRAKYTVHQLKAGSMAEKEQIPFEKEYTELKAAGIASALETAIWKGDKDSGTANLNKFDGLLKIIDAAGTAVAGNTSDETEISAENVITIFQNIYEAIPVQVLDGSVSFCGWDTFRKFVVKLTNNNWFHYTAEAPNGEIVLPGTSHKIIAVNGLNGTNRIISGKPTNFYYGVDMLNDSETFEIWYSKDNDHIRFKAEFTAGVQVAYPSEIVEFTLAS